MCDVMWRCFGGGIIVVVDIVEVVFLLWRWFCCGGGVVEMVSTSRCVNKPYQTEPVGCYENSVLATV